MTSNDLTMTVEAFTRSVAVNRRVSHALFVGAGASLTSRMPSAEKCIMEWKTRIFSTANPGLEKQVAHPFLPSVQQMVQAWLDKQPGFPAAASPEEYSKYFEICFPVAADRRAYFQDFIKSAQPSFGYELLILLAEAGLFNSVWTTNFDGLTARAATGSAVVAIEIGLDSTHRIDRSPRNDELLCVAMHGDYRYDALRNTEKELQSQDAKLRKSLEDHLKDRTLIVVGYSGRDESVMEALENAFSKPGTGRLFWCGFRDKEPPEKIKKLIEVARAAGREAYYVKSNGFDDIMRRLALHSLDGDLSEKAKALLAQHESAAAHAKIEFTIANSGIKTLVKSNCFPVDCPTELYQFTVPSFRKKGAWALLREAISNSQIVAGMLGQNVVALGSLSEISSTFGNLIDGKVERIPVAEHELYMPNGVISGILRQALVRSLAERTGLKNDGDSMIWEPKPFIEEMEVYRWKCAIFRSVIVGLRRASGKQYLTLTPTVFGKTKSGEDLPDFVAKEVKRKILSTQYNDEFNKELEYWRKLLLPKDTGRLEYPPKCASTFSFAISRVPAFGGISSEVGDTTTVPEKHLSLVHFKGFCLPEPKVIYSSRDGRFSATDDHPIRGLLKNRPFDHPLTTSGLDADVRIGVVCPKVEAPKLRQFLTKLHQKTRANSKQGYLLDYPGFSDAFGLPLVVPESIEPAWCDCPEPSGSNDRERAISLAKDVRTCIQTITGTSSIRLVLVFIPERWLKWADYSSDGDDINLHDLTKVFCVERGIASQMLREKTLTKRFDCEVMWWLALSLYAKSMRTPWVLDGLPSTTAYVGLGFSLMRKAAGKHVVLGCSHIYSSDGLGLNYRLSKIDNAIFVQRNPHLSEEDAVAVGEGIRQLFFESRGRLPERVVIHKRTPFLKAEREGLLRGLRDVGVVDLVEINVEASIRCTAAVEVNGGFAAAGMPVERGTALLVDKNQFLLWVNGNAHPTPGGDYYMGRYRIPAPVMVKKHWGPSNMDVLASEIMSLSKMNWNTFDLYTRLPATIHSSNEIAQIGRRLRRFGRDSFDYRLFI